MSTRNKWLDWKPASPTPAETTKIFSDFPESEASKPTKPGFDGFVGSSLANSQNIWGTTGHGVAPSESDTSSGCIPAAADHPVPSRDELTMAPAAVGPRKREGVEIALRWYCSACSMDAVFWHLPAVTCDVKERAVIREHGERQPGCRRLDYRIMSDSETRPRREA